MFRNNLNHGSRFTVRINLNGVSILWIIENSHVAWHVLLISIVFTTSIGIHFIRPWNKFFLPTDLFLKASKNSTIVEVILFVFRDLELLFEDHFSLSGEVSSWASYCSTVEVVSLECKIFFWFARCGSTNITSMTNVKSEIIVSFFNICF